MIEMFRPFMPTEEVLRELRVTLNSKFIGEGPRVREFEDAFAKYIGSPSAVAVNSGTSALELAYDLLDLKEGDHVITPVLTCTATNHPLLRRKCDIEWADIEIGNNLNPRPSDILSKIRPDTKAIVIVHLGGDPFDVDSLKDAGVPIIEDCAQALGARYKNNKIVGNSGNLCAFSLQAIKHITTGDGGMLICPNADATAKAKRRRWFGIDREAKVNAGWHPSKGGRLTFQVTEAGYKYQMTDITATIGLVQMEFIGYVLAKRRQLYYTYVDGLSGVNNVQIMAHSEGSSHWIFGIIVPDRDKLIEALEDNGIESNVVQMRNDVYEVFGGRKKLPQMDIIENNYLYLPLHASLTTSDVKFICEVIRNEME